VEVHSIRTWFDRHEGVVVVDDDVQNVVRGIKEISDRLHVYANPQSGGFDIVEHCLDGAERLVFSVSELDHRVIHRLHQTDHWYGQELPNHVLGDSEDFVARMDEYNDELQEAIDEKGRDKLRDAGLRLAWALDAVGDHHSVGGSIRVPKDLDAQKE
jgi:hypothetical protein